jgi:hypothetical protein
VRRPPAVPTPAARLTVALAAVLAGVALAGAVLLAVAGPAAGQEDPPAGATTEDTPVPARDIIPRPDSGTPPGEAGDRGGALQIAVFAAIVAGVCGIVALIVRDSRRARRPVSPAGRTPRRPYSRR